MQTFVDSTPSFPGRRLRMGIVGLRFGAQIARILARDNPWLEVVAVCDLDEVRARQISQELGVPVLSLEVLLADESIETIGLFTGPVNRAALIRKLIRAGKHVLTTKPFEIDPEAARAVLEEAESLGRVVHLNSPGPSPAGDLQQIQAWQQEYDLGRPLAMRAETWASYREKSDGSWYDDPSACGAAPLLRLGIYFFNDFASLPGTPDTVQVMHSRLHTGRPTADHAQIGIHYKNGALGHIFASFCINDGMPYRDMVTFNYENATIRRWMDKKPNISAEEACSVLELQRPGFEQSLKIETSPGDWSGWYQWKAFHDAVIRPIPSGRSGRDKILFGIHLLEAASRSFLSGAPQSVTGLN